MPETKFSVLMSVYHKEKPEYLDLALKSIWDDQALKPDQIVLVKDGPLTNQLDSIIEIWKKSCPVLKIVSLEKNVGLGQALNVGLNECSFSLVARMDADDISLPDRFRKQIELFGKQPEIDICGTWCTEINEKNELKRKRKVPTEDEDIKRLVWSCPINHPTVMFRKEKILEAGSYNAKIAHRQEDYELWIRCSFAGLKFANLSESLLHYRITDEYFKKNSVGVGFNRFLIGLKAVRKFDPRLQALLGISYPFFRSNER
jgi:amylovoran biosynthesis glycosyltransferase AmsE